VHPLEAVALVAGSACVFAWAASVLSGDYSWVDRSWSILPVIYVAIFAAWAHLRDPRLDVMALLVLTWGARLTFNFARKGGYSGVEDYRWGVLRSRMSRWQFQLFNVFFVVIYQNLLLVLISLPALSAYEHRSSELGGWFLSVAALFVLCTIGETVADQQQWDFQVAKGAALGDGRAVDADFCQDGMFRYSRHPAYFFELAQWWLLFVMGAIAAGSLAQWTVVGAALLTALFVGSTRFTESISASKYPEYAGYQRRTSAIVPWPPRRRALTAPTGPN
jgi:steroid 5-alpha reductase family enzyme